MVSFLVEQNLLDLIFEQILTQFDLTYLNNLWLIGNVYIVKFDHVFLDQKQNRTKLIKLIFSSLFQQHLTFWSLEIEIVQLDSLVLFALKKQKIFAIKLRTFSQVIQIDMKKKLTIFAVKLNLRTIPKDQKIALKSDQL